MKAVLVLEMDWDEDTPTHPLAESLAHLKGVVEATEERPGVSLVQCLVGIQDVAERVLAVFPPEKTDA